MTGRTIDALCELALCTGSLDAGARRAGQGRGYLSKLRGRGSVTVGRVEAWLSAFGVVPRNFHLWTEAVSGEDVLERFGREALDLAVEHGEPPPIRQVRLAYLRGELPAAAETDIAERLAEIDDLRPDAAHRYVSLALDLAQPGGVDEGKLRGMLAQVAVSRGALPDAEAHFLRAIDLLADEPADRLFATAQLVRLLVSSGRTGEACEQARALVSLTEAVDEDPVLAAALLDLVRAALGGPRALSIGIVDRVIEQVEKAMADRTTRSPMARQPLGSSMYHDR